MRIVDQLPDYHIAYLEGMLERNVLWWKHPAEWDKMFQYEILDRQLVTPGSLDHQALLELLEAHRAAR